MANLVVADKPQLTLQMAAMETSTPAHCDQWNTRHQQLLNNDKYLSEQIKETIKNTGEKLEKSAIIDDLDTALAVTEDKVPVGCKAMQELNSNLNDSLKDGLKMTEDERKMLEYIYKANGGSNIETDMKVVKYIGQGTSFDIKTLYPASYQNFTADNFFCEPISSNSGSTSPGTHGYEGSNFYADYSFNKTYNVNTGVLSVTSIVNFNINFAQYGYLRSNQQKVKAYIVL